MKNSTSSIGSRATKPAPPSSVAVVPSVTVTTTAFDAPGGDPERDHVRSEGRSGGWQRRHGVPPRRLALEELFLDLTRRRGSHRELGFLRRKA
ncbi:MAG TPA: hypothetical protein VGV93_02975 [Acidimicrobiales bacterium]|nr:hypothetical protein [Acidimicrobiales bacterium]